MNCLFLAPNSLIAHRRFNQDNTAIIDRFDVYVGLYDITSGTLTHSISPPQNHSVMDALYENGVATLLLKDDTEELIRIGFYDFQNSAEPQLLPLDDTNTNQTRITFGRISQSGKLAAYGDNKGLIKVFDVASGQKVKELREHSDEILYLNFSWTTLG